MLRRLGHGCWSNGATLGLLGCRRSTLVGVRSVSSDHLVSGSGDMDPASSASPAATNARWALLNCRVSRRDESIVADARTVADCRASAFGGGQLRVSLSVAPPPGSSFLYFDWTGSGSGGDGPQEFDVSAAHGDSVLLKGSEGFLQVSEGFVYRAGAATRPPSLSPLPPARDLWRLRKATRSTRTQRGEGIGVGLLRRGEDELLVAQLDVTAPWDADTFFAEVWVLHVGRSKWELKPATPIILDGGDEGDAGAAVKRDRDRLYPWLWPRCDKANAVPVADRFLCWVDYVRGFLVLGDMADPERPGGFRFVSLPVVVVPPGRTDREYEDGRCPEIEASRVICGVGVGGLKFVSIDLRCSCCARSPTNAEFLVRTWTLELRTDGGPMAWVRDAALDCEELWALPGYDGLPRVRPTWPVVSLDNPDVICFRVDEIELDRSKESKIWMIQVDMRKKALLSVVHCTRMIQVDMRKKALLSVVHCTRYPMYFYPHLPVKLHY